MKKRKKGTPPKKNRPVTHADLKRDQEHRDLLALGSSFLMGAGAGLANAIMTRDPCAAEKAAVIAAAKAWSPGDDDRSQLITLARAVDALLVAEKREADYKEAQIKLAATSKIGFEDPSQPEKLEDP